MNDANWTLKAGTPYITVNEMTGEASEPKTVVADVQVKSVLLSESGYDVFEDMNGNTYYVAVEEGA